MQAIDMVVKSWPVLLSRLAGYYFLLVACPAIGQALQKKTLTEGDYKLWGSLVNQQISGHGQWVSYGMRYDATDTLFVKNTATAKTFAYPRHHEGEFGGDTWFACRRNDTLALQNLWNGKLAYLPGVARFSFSANGRYLLLFYCEKDETESLVVKDSNGQIVFGATGLSGWKLNEDKSAVAYTTTTPNAQAVDMVTLGDKITKNTIVEAAEGAFTNLVWQKELLAFAHDLGKGSVYLYNSKKGKRDHFMPEHYAEFPKEMQVSPHGFITISADGSRVAFGLKEPAGTAPKDELVQVWQANDRQLYPSVKKYGDFTLYEKAAVWLVKSNRFLQLNDRKTYVVALGPKGKHALSYDPMAYEPYPDIDVPRDVYAIDLTTGKKELILKKASGYYETLQLSPEGRYVCYVRERNWWVYDLLNRTHKNVTATLGVPVYEVDFDRAGEVPLYGIAGWSPNDKSLLVYDQYDIWQVRPDGSRCTRLTNGRETNTRFRVDNSAPVANTLTDGTTTISQTVDLAQGLLLKAQNSETGFSGFYSLDTEKGLRQLVWHYGRTDRPVRARAADCFSYVAERFDSPPTLMFYSDHKTTQVFQSNRHHDRYQWGQAQRITYSARGSKLSGVLFLPAGYDRSKTYPMIVSIYEDQGAVRHQYVNPTLFNEGGINTANLTAQGYFVLFPDLAYTMGDVGNSVVDCLMAATDAVLAQYPIDGKRLGLTGHSFGGYETLLAITKTHRFAAALAGSASSDPVSTYLQVGGNNKPNIFRFENQQYRMGCSLFADTERYLRNSPVLLAEGVQTPILCWAGELDNNVNPLQSKEFYLAMRRLGKEHTLLIYPDEGHTLSAPLKQTDLTHRFEGWFAKYLKP